ncbi:uncharacterized protein LOC127865770 [Dreissena polymorpha]|uniref:uncharacterized protein LOC127865770 n=1 Tax=Dreissena polymorpha TaxID=45954 RepID=UPI00226527CB|nr:uncharacterized protein LOC127865770 [Dreissena polymorpha]
MDERLQSAQCVINGSCTQKIQATCEQSSRKRRATQTIGITIVLQANLLFDGSGLNLDEMINGKEPSSDCIGLFFVVAYLENTTQTVFNESESMFTFTIGGITYVTNSTSVAVTPSVQCPSGKVPLEYLCVTVPAGSYSNSVDAVVCPIGTFKEKPGQMSCAPCPAGTTTEGIGSDNATDCSITDIGSDTSGSTPANMVPKQQNTEDNGKASVAVIVGIVAAVVFAAVLVTGLLVYNTRAKIMYAGYDKVRSVCSHFLCTTCLSKLRKWSQPKTRS